MLGVAGVDILPSLFHARDFFSVFEFGKEGFFEIRRNGAREDARDVHVRIAGTGETEIDDTDNFVVLIKEDVAEIEIAVNKIV